MSVITPRLGPAPSRITHRGDGSVVIDDPSVGPWRVRAWVDTTTGRTRITRLQVDVRPERGGDITAAALARLPMAQIRHAARVAAASAVDHPNEPYYRMLAAPRPAGRRRWDAGHWERVLEVYRWAESTGRPGGPLQAVADLWDVSRHPTASRWVAYARRRPQDSMSPT
jgi:hypothetical protein